jgi:hypothetical protein
LVYYLIKYFYLICVWNFLDFNIIFYLHLIFELSNKIKYIYLFAFIT